MFDVAEVPALAHDDQQQADHQAVNCGGFCQGTADEQGGLASTALPVAKLMPKPAPIPVKTAIAAPIATLMMIFSFVFKNDYMRTDVTRPVLPTPNPQVLSSLGNLKDKLAHSMVSLVNNAVRNTNTIA